MDGMPISADLLVRPDLRDMDASSYSRWFFCRVGDEELAIWDGPTAPIGQHSIVGAFGMTVVPDEDLPRTQIEWGLAYIRYWYGPGSEERRAVRDRQRKEDG